MLFEGRKPWGTLKKGYLNEIRKLEKNVNAKLARIEGNLEYGMEEGLVVVEEQSREYCPEDTGTLIESHHHRVKKKGKNVVGEIIVDATVKQRKLALNARLGSKPKKIRAEDATTSYALAVHEEDKQYRHGKSYKYLQRAAVDKEKEFVRTVGTAVKRAVDYHESA